MSDLSEAFADAASERIAMIVDTLMHIRGGDANEESWKEVQRHLRDVKGMCSFLTLTRLMCLVEASEDLAGAFSQSFPIPDEGIMLLTDLVSHLGNRVLSRGNSAEDDVLFARIRKFTALQQKNGSIECPAGVPEGPSYPRSGRAWERESGVTVHAPMPAGGLEKRVDRPVELQNYKRMSGSLRVNVKFVDHIVNLVADLILTRNQLVERAGRCMSSHFDSDVVHVLQSLCSASSRLQEEVMRLRMQPIGTIWIQFPRMVHDFSRDLEKKITLVMTGDEVAMDRYVLEMIQAPLVHMIRNALDHGLESPQERLEAGKSEEGMISLSAYHEGGFVVISLADNGRGLDSAKIARRALASGLRSAAELEKMDQEQIQRLIFTPGFSLSESVSDISGRGVGMDVVAENIASVGGVIRLSSLSGKGTVFTVKVPVSLSIINVLIIESCGQIFAIPQITLVEVVKLGPDREELSEKVKNTPILHYGGKLIPVFRIRDILSRYVDRGDVGPVDEEDSRRASASVEVMVVVVRVGMQVFGILADRVFDLAEIVVRRLPDVLRSLDIVSGSAVLGDGRIALILALDEIVRLLGLEREMHPIRGDMVPDTCDKAGGKGAPMLVFQGSANEVARAFPVRLMTRLEPLESLEVRKTDHHYIANYQGTSMLMGNYEQCAGEGGKNRFVLIFGRGGHSVGLCVNGKPEVVQFHRAVDITTEAPGILGYGSFRKELAEVVHVSDELRAHFRHWFDHVHGENPDCCGQVLFMTPSPFFLNALTCSLEAEGFLVDSTGSMEEALSMRDSGRKFQAILLDTNIPGPDVCGFMQRVRQEGGWKEAFIVALVGPCDGDGVQPLTQWGFDAYVQQDEYAEILKCLREFSRHEVEAA